MVVAFIDDRTFFVLLRIKVAREVCITRTCGIGQPYVCESSAGELVYQSTIVFNPRPRSKSLFACDGDHGHDSRSFSRGSLTDPDQRLPSSSTFEHLVEIAGRLEWPAVYFKQVISFGNLNARC